MPMLEALVCEVHSSALLTATIASAINAMKRTHGGLGEAELRPYIPGEPAIVSVLRNGMLETDLNADTVRLVIQLFDDLTPARLALEHYFSEANAIGAERAVTLNLLTLSTSWRRSCQDALLAVRQLQSDIHRLPAQYTSNSKLLNNLLQDAIMGGSPCLDARGAIALPELPQRRQSARRTVCQPCTLTYNRQQSQAFVRDVSPGGFGLERVPQLIPTTIVQIELPSGRRFTGSVAWCSGSSAGVRFSRPLLPNDPLLSGG
ncbi:PilZ domain-containing protein [Hyphomicrobium sp. D-2]|uniref:PilZ domain-containing protein n=1 Tax=Hyphomicrobium sp. D-2 TaxID=3041621 RepID=UPI0024584148|nr:PilZ domain-containing protein [Hyphomicrobium sp. D-2]MDH4982316.1 PilZ domain-containing protein [Hyphomicrobium sp. D-2]